MTERRSGKDRRVKPSDGYWEWLRPTGFGDVDCGPFVNNRSGVERRKQLTGAKPLRRIKVHDDSGGNKS